MQLSKRLKTLAQLVNETDVVVDVGCDHALLAIYLVLQKQVPNIFVSDINQQALLNAQKNISKYNLQAKIPTILAGGIKWIVNYSAINCVIIAGLGTNKILKILNDDLTNIKRYIIQSNTNVDSIRQWVKTNNFYLETELLMQENGRIYEIIVINKTSGYAITNDEEILFGVKLDKDNPELFNEQWQQKLVHYQKIVKNLPVLATKEPLIKWIEEITNKIQKLSQRTKNDDLCKWIKK